LFVGHFAVGFASKRLAPSASLATLIAASVFLDVLFTVLLLTDVEHVRVAADVTQVMPFDAHDYPWSHGLLMSMVWGIVLAATHFARKRNPAVAVVLGVGVFSHFILDWITHRSDMPLFPGGSTRVGLGLWNHRVATLLVEGALFVAGVALYATGTRARDRSGTIGLWLYVALLSAVYLASIFGPPPTDLTRAAMVSLVANLLFVWVAWFDRHREALYSH